jgi:mannan polymerase II complex MNN11 subunit
MHFAYLPRKNSNPPPFVARSSKIPSLRRARLKTVAIACLVFIAIIYLFVRSTGRHTTPTKTAPSGKPPVVIVTVLEEGKLSKGYIDNIRENRVQYAEKHGSQCPFYPKDADC